MFIAGIPDLGLNTEQPNAMRSNTAEALGVPPGTVARVCIMQLDSGFPNMDLTELADIEQREPLQNKDRGLFRLCLVLQDLADDYERP